MPKSILRFWAVRLKPYCPKSQDVLRDLSILSEPRQLENYVTTNYNCIFPLSSSFEWNETTGRYVQIEATEAIKQHKVEFESQYKDFLSLMD